MSKRDCKLILALDLPEREQALEILRGLRGKLDNGSRSKFCSQQDD